jgi:hypothetical protein
VQKQPTEWEKIFVNHTLDKRLVSYMKKSYKSTVKRQLKLKMSKRIE